MQFYIITALLVYMYNDQLDWLALHLKVGNEIDQLFLEIIRSYLFIYLLVSLHIVKR